MIVIDYDEIFKREHARCMFLIWITLIYVLTGVLGLFLFFIFSGCEGAQLLSGLIATIFFDFDQVEVMADPPLMVHGVTHIMQHSVLMDSVLWDHVFLLEFVYFDALQDCVIIILLAIDVTRTIRLKSQMLQRRPLMYYIIVTHDNLNFALGGGRTALCICEAMLFLLSFFSALGLLIVLVIRNFFRDYHRQSVSLLISEHFLIL